MPPFKNKQKPAIDAAVTASAYLNLKEQIKRLTKQANEYREQLEEWLGENGTITEMEHIQAIVKHGNRSIQIEKQCRKSDVIKLDAEETIRTEMPHLVSELVETTEIFRYDRLEELLLNGDISEEDVKKLVNVEKNYAFNVKKIL